jgi:hypothetical protein
MAAAIHKPDIAKNWPTNIWTSRLDHYIIKKNFLFCKKRVQLNDQDTCLKTGPVIKWSKNKMADHSLTRQTMVSLPELNMSGFGIIPDFGCPDFGR